MAGIDMDLSELHGLAVDLGKVAGRTLPLVDAVVKKAAQNVKDEMVSDANASRHFKQIAHTISYDRAYDTGQVAYEVGPDRARGGGASLAGAYLGWSRGGGGSLSLDGPVDHEEPRMLKALGEALERAL